MGYKLPIKFPLIKFTNKIDFVCRPHFVYRG